MSALPGFNLSVYARLLTRYLPKPIESQRELDAATKILLDLDERDDLLPEEAAVAELLAVLIEDYEDKHDKLPDVPPHRSPVALMEERGLQHKDIWPVLGNKGATTEILSGRRSISKAQAKRLAAFFRVPVDSFL